MGFTRYVPLSEIKDLVLAAIDGGLSEKEAVQHISEVLDAAIDFTTLIAGPAGAVIESVDRTFFRLVVRTLYRAAQRARSDKA